MSPNHPFEANRSVCLYRGRSPESDADKPQLARQAPMRVETACWRRAGHTAYAAARLSPASILIMDELKPIGGAFDGRMVRFRPYRHHSGQRRPCAVQITNAPASPNLVRRVYIPKPGKEEKRPPRRIRNPKILNTFPQRAARLEVGARQSHLNCRIHLGLKTSKASSIPDCTERVFEIVWMLHILFDNQAFW